MVSSLPMKKAMKVLPLIGICILAYLILRIGPEAILATFGQVEAVYLAPAILLFLLSIGIQNLKWEHLLRRQGIDAGFFTLFKIYLIGSFYGIITPGRIGNFIRIRYIKKRIGRNTGESAVSIVLDKVIEFGALFSLSIAGMLLMANYLSFEIMLVLSALCVAFLAAIFMLFRKGVSGRMLKIFWRTFVPAKMKANARNAFNSFYDNILDWKQMILPFILSLFGWMVLYTSTYMIGLSLGMDVPHSTFVAVMPIATLIGLIPVTVGGWGTREATMIFLFSFFGIGSDAVMVMSIIAALLTYCMTAVLGGAFALSEGRKAVA
jgi:uncharacterized protein (TIRG00374 family)